MHSLRLVTFIILMASPPAFAADDPCDTEVAKIVINSDISHILQVGMRVDAAVKAQHRHVYEGIVESTFMQIVGYRKAECPSAVTIIDDSTINIEHDYKVNITPQDLQETARYVLDYISSRLATKGKTLDDLRRSYGIEYLKSVAGR